MRRAALYICGKIVVADSHIMAFQQLTLQERDAAFDGQVVSGFFNENTAEFESDMPQDHFYDKEMILVRHPNTCDDGPNPHLSPEGFQKAHEVAENLKDFDLSDYQGITSPMTRCLETAEVLHKELELPFQVEPQIVETPTFLQEDESFKIKNLHSQYPEFSWKTKEDITVRKESEADFRSRVRDVLLHFPHRCILVTHFGVIFHISQVALCEKKAERLLCTGIPRGSITVIKRDVMQMIGNNDENILGYRQQAEN